MGRISELYRDFFIAHYDYQRAMQFVKSLANETWRIAKKYDITKEEVEKITEDKYYENINVFATLYAIQKSIEELRKGLAYIRYYTENTEEREEILEFLLDFKEQLKSSEDTKESDLPDIEIELETIGKDFLLRFPKKSKVGYIYKGDRLVAEIMLK